MPEQTSAHKCERITGVQLKYQHSGVMEPIHTPLHHTLHVLWSLLIYLDPQVKKYKILHILKNNKGKKSNAFCA
jgi:hypothetical protein